MPKQEKQTTPHTSGLSEKERAGVRKALYELADLAVDQLVEEIENGTYEGKVTLTSKWSVDPNRHI